jgi:hypothetical protein
LTESTLAATLASVALLEFQHPDPRMPGVFRYAALSGFVVEAGRANYTVSAAHFDARSHSFVGRFFGQGARSSLSIALRELDQARNKDIAVFSVDNASVAARLSPAPVAADSDFSVGDDAYIVGYPYPDLLRDHWKLDDPIQVVKKGVVSAKVAPRADRSAFLLLDAIWDQGMSGGPVIHAATGHVIGVVSSRPIVQGQMLEFITCPSGDQILEALSRLNQMGA